MLSYHMQKMRPIHFAFSFVTIYWRSPLKTKGEQDKMADCEFSPAAKDAEPAKCQNILSEDSEMSENAKQNQSAKQR